MPALFSGSGQCLNSGTTRSQIQNITKVTVMAWCRTSSLSATQLICKWSTNGGSNVTRISLGVLLTSGIVQVSGRSLDADTQSTNSGSAGVSTNTWTHLCLTCDSSSTAWFIYINGVQDSTGIFATMTNGAFQNLVSLAGGIACGNPGGSANSLWVGDIEDFRIYQRVLTANEIKTIVNSRGRSVNIPNLVGHWPLREGGIGATLTGAVDMGFGKSASAGVTGSPTYSKGRISFRRPAA
jgi:hypothetical protein